MPPSAGGGRNGEALHRARAPTYRSDVLDRIGASNTYSTNLTAELSRNLGDDD
jgi:hypothetical protein